MTQCIKKYSWCKLMKIQKSSVKICLNMQKNNQKDKLLDSINRRILNKQVHTKMKMTQQKQTCYYNRVTPKKDLKHEPSG